MNHHKCDNCETVYGDDHIIRLDYVKDLQQRLTPGGITPSGECPNCGALVYLAEIDAGKLQTIIRERQGISNEESLLLTETEAQPEATEDGLWCNVRIWHPLENIGECLVTKRLE